jgi:hypothetical protein
MKLSHVTAALLATLALAVAGCERDEGPMEDMGEKVDQAVESDSETFENAGRAADEAVDEAKKKLKGDDDE